MPEEELNNLARIGQLEGVPYSKQLMQKMLATAGTRLQDAQRTQNSAESRLQKYRLTEQSQQVLLNEQRP